MADKKLSELTELAAQPADNDEVYIRDISEPSATESKRITIANLLAGVSGATIVRKTADEIVNNNNTPQNDDHLFFAMGANEVWLFDLVLIGLTAVATPRFRIVVIAPTGAVGYGVASRSVSGSPNQCMMIELTDVSDCHSPTNIECICVIKIVVINGVNAGNFQLQWAQMNATAEDTTLKEDSYLIARRLL